MERHVRGADKHMQGINADDADAKAQQLLVSYWCLRFSVEVDP